jgi:hypothetical protein
VRTPYAVFWWPRASLPASFLKPLIVQTTLAWPLDRPRQVVPGLKTFLVVFCYLDSFFPLLLNDTA